MDAKELADKFEARVTAAALERDRLSHDAVEDQETRLRDAEYCKQHMTNVVVPFLAQVKSEFPAEQFSFAPQIDPEDHQFVGVAFRVGDGPIITISVAFGNVVVSHSGASGSSKGVDFIYARDAEPFIANSGDLTQDKVAKLIEMVIDDV